MFQHHIWTNSWKVRERIVRKLRSKYIFSSMQSMKQNYFVWKAPSLVVLILWVNGTGASEYSLSTEGLHNTFLEWLDVQVRQLEITPWTAPTRRWTNPSFLLTARKYAESFVKKWTITGTNPTCGMLLCRCGEICGTGWASISIDNLWPLFHLRILPGNSI